MHFSLLIYDLATKQLETHEPKEPEALRSGIPKGERSRASGSAGAHDLATRPPQTHEPQAHSISLDLSEFPPPPSKRDAGNNPNDQV